MPSVLPKTNLNAPVTEHMHQDFIALRSGQTVSEALAWVQQHPTKSRIIYFYVVDEDGRLRGVAPTRQLLLSPPHALVADIMVSQVTTLAARATVRQACERFLEHRLLALPVVDDDGRLLGTVDMDIVTAQLGRLDDVPPVNRLLRPLARFLAVESSSGIVLLACTVVALILANSPWSAAFHDFWHTPIGLTVGAVHMSMSLHHGINDGLMTLFFFVVGLEIKREIVAGELSELKKAMLPIVAALGGMVVPAAVYLIFHFGQPTAQGWGIPMATDIAFVVGFLALLGPRVPHSLKILLLSLAIADDIGATLVIALVYTADLALPALAAGVAGFGLIICLRWLGVRRVLVYFVVGTVIWAAFSKSGVHPTVAGVALGLLTPARPWLGDRLSLDVVVDLFRRVGASGTLAKPEQRLESISPVERLEHALHPWVAFLIMPVFALANAGVHLELAEIGKPVALAVAAGLILGKPIGIALFCWASARLGLTRLPAEINGKILIGAGCLAGIGFTMSLFIAGLALEGRHLEEAKIGILGGSTVSAVLGFWLLARFLPRQSSAADRA